MLPGAVYALLLSMRRSKEGLRWALLVAMSAAWIGWFTLLSVGWPRYAFLALTLAAIFVARLLQDLTGGFRLPLGELVSGIRSGQVDLKLAQETAVLTLLAVVVLHLLSGRFVEVITSRDDSPQQMAAYITEHLPREAEIETYEPEICFLSGYPCHFPPQKAFNAALRYVWYNGPPPSEYYAFREVGAPYLLIGRFGRWVSIYDPDVVADSYEHLVSIGSYELYQMKQNQ